jgi:Zn-dependent protease with chaperone function
MAAAMAKVFFLIPLLAYGTFEFSVLLTDRYFPKLLLMIVVGGLLALWKSASILLKKVPLEFNEPMARAVTPEEAPELWQAVRSAAERLQTTPPDRILLGLQLNFYVTELAVRHDGGRAEGKTLYLSFPLLKQLSVDEVTAIMGHELGHFIGEDTKMSREFYPLRLKARATMVAMAQSGWIGWPSFQFLNFFSWCFGGTEQAASRARELLADQKAAVLTSPQTAAHALVRFQVAMEAFQYGLKEAVKNQAQNPLDVPLQGIVQEKLAPDAAFWTRLFEKKLPHPLDSHPSLHVRLEALGQTVSVEAARRVALVNEESAYEKWFSHRSELFTNLSRQAEAAVEKLRSRTALAEADYQTEAGKRLLEEHFPEKKWPVRQSSLQAILALLGFLAIVSLAATIFIDNAGARVVFGITLLLLALAMTVKAKRQHKAELVLNADGLYHSGWARPLRFKEIQNISGRRYSSNIILTFHLKEKQPSLWKFCVIRLSANKATLSLSGLDGKPVTIANTIIQYFTRRQAE